MAEHLDDEDLVLLDATTHLSMPEQGPYTVESVRATFDAEHVPGAHFADLLTDFAEHDAASPAPTARTFEAHRRPELLRSTEEVRAALGDPGTVLVNVLDPKTYSGEKEGYARAGHIPGSINLPVSEVTDPATGTLKSAEELRTLFASKGLLDPGVTPVTYCGGGIAATGVAHALALAGREDVAVYDGSMTAWAADESLPLVTGDEPE